MFQAPFSANQLRQLIDDVVDAEDDVVKSANLSSAECEFIRSHPALYVACFFGLHAANPTVYIVAVQLHEDARARLTTLNSITP